MGDSPPTNIPDPHPTDLTPAPPPEEVITFNDGAALGEAQDGEVGEMQNGEFGDEVEVCDDVVEPSDGLEVDDGAELGGEIQHDEVEQEVDEGTENDDEHGGEVEYAEVVDGEEILEDEEFVEGEEVVDGEEFVQDEELGEDEYDGQVESGEVAEEPYQNGHGENGEDYEDPEQYEQQHEYEEELSQDNLMENAEPEHGEHDEHVEHDQDYEPPGHEEEPTQDDLMGNEEPEHDGYDEDYQVPEHGGEHHEEDEQLEYEDELDQGEPDQDEGFEHHEHEEGHEEDYEDPEQDDLMEGEHLDEHEEELEHDGQPEQDVIMEDENPEPEKELEHEEQPGQDGLVEGEDLELEEGLVHEEDSEVTETLYDEHGDPQQDEPDMQDGQQILNEEAEQAELMDEFEILGDGREQNEPQQPNDLDIEDLFNDETQVDDPQENIGDLDTLMNDLQDNVEDPETQMEDLEDNAEGMGNRMEGIQTTSHGQASHRAAAIIPEVPTTPEPRPTTSTAQNQINDQIVENEDSDSLFMPYDRLPSPPPNFFTKPSKSSRQSKKSSRGSEKSSRRSEKSARRPERPATPGPSSRPSQPLNLSFEPSGLPRDSNRHSDYNPLTRPSTMTPPTIPSKPPASLFARIREMQQKKEQSKLAAAKAPSFAGPSSNEQPTYLSRILSRQPLHQQSGAAILAADPDDDKKVNAAARAKFQKDKNHYDALRKSRGGRLDFADEIKWMKISDAEELRLRKRKRDREMDSQEDDGFRIRPAPSMSFDTNTLENDWDEDVRTNFGEGPSSASQPASSPPSGRVFQSLAEAEIESMRVALQAEGDARPSKKKKKGARKSKDGKDSRDKTKAGVRKSTKEKKAAENASRMKASLLKSDVFHQQADEDVPEQPTFKARNKAGALKELIASVPIEHQKTARDDTAALLRATKDFDGKGSCKADGNGMWKIRGMSTSLKHYQVMGTAFMRRRENDLHEPRGGLMADQMGLGKTLMTLANIVNGRGNGDQDCKTTLLVASPALITQWQREINLHTDCGLNYMKYTSGNRVESNQVSKILEQNDIVLTTYHEICRSYPKNSPPRELETVEQKVEWWRKVYEEKRGPLHRMMVSIFSSLLRLEGNHFVQCYLPITSSIELYWMRPSPSRITLAELQWVAVL